MPAQLSECLLVIVGEGRREAGDETGVKAGQETFHHSGGRNGRADYGPAAGTTGPSGPTSVKPH